MHNRDVCTSACISASVKRISNSFYSFSTEKIQFEPFFSACKDTDFDSRTKSYELVDTHMFSRQELLRGLVLRGEPGDWR